MHLEQLPDEVSQRQERVRGLLRGETPGRPIAYLCPVGHTWTRTREVIDEVRAARDLSYLAGFQSVGVRGVLEEDNDNTPILWPAAGGVHFIDSLFGIRPAARGSRLWGDPLQWDPEGGLPDFDSRGGLLPRALEEITFLRERFGALPIAPPDLSGPLNGALNVFDNRRLLRLAGRDPAAARRAVEHVARAILAVGRVLFEAIGPNSARCTPPHSWVPPEHVLLPWCSSQLVSAETYEKVVRPADEMVLREFGGGVLHICGRSTHLIPALRDMKPVLGVELVGSPGAYDPTLDYRAYFEGLRDDQVVVVMVGRVSPDEPLDVLRRERTGRISAREVMDVSGGERTILRFTNAEALRRFRGEHHGD